MLLASKYEEMYAPEVNDFVYITDVVAALIFKGFDQLRHQGFVAGGQTGVAHQVNVVFNCHFGAWKVEGTEPESIASLMKLFTVRRR